MSRLGWRSIKSCSLASEKKLPNCPVKMLRELCENLGLNVDGTYRSLICLPSLLEKGHVQVNDTCQNYNYNYYYYYYYYYYYFFFFFFFFFFFLNNKKKYFLYYNIPSKIDIYKLKVEKKSY